MKNNIRPAEGWIFVEPLEKPYGVIRQVSVDMDTCCIYDIIQYEEQHTIAIKQLGLLAVRVENITKWGEHETVQLGRSEK